MCLFFCITGVFCLEEKTVTGIVLTCLPPCKYGNHMLGLSAVHKRLVICIMNKSIPSLEFIAVL